MRDYHLQTPQKVNRHPKSISDHAKKNQKIVKKSLSSALSAVSEDVSVSESPKDLIDISSISDILEPNLIGELYEDLTASSAEASPGSEDAASSVLNPSSSTITSDDHERSGASTNQSIINKSENFSLSCFEAELVVKHLREAQLQLFDERTRDLQSKRLLDALINVIIKEFYAIPEEEESYYKIIPRKAYLAFLSILLSILATYVVIICSSGSRHAFNGPPPT